MQVKTTGQLEQELSGSAHVEDYLKGNTLLGEDCSVSGELSRFLEEQGLRRAQVIERSNLNAIYAYQIISGRRQPTRDKLLCLCLAMELEAEECQKLLKRCGYPPLYARKQRDSLILFGFHKHQSVLDVNEQLLAHGAEIL